MAMTAEEVIKQAENGDPITQYAIGMMYRTGEEIKYKREIAYHWLIKSAEQGYAEAQYEVGLLLSKPWHKSFFADCCYSEFDEVPFYDEKKAFQWFVKAAEQGLSKAQYRVANCYYSGCGIDINYNKAFEWYMKAAKQGDCEAQYHIACMYEKGQGVEPDYEKAYKWFEVSAAQGCGKAMYPVACAYKGDDYEKLFNWYCGAAESGCQEAYYPLGCMYYHGKGVGQSYDKAFEYYMLAAYPGISEEAQYAVGSMYEKGELVKQDTKKAIEWYIKAAKQGSEDAKGALKRLRVNTSLKYWWLFCSTRIIV